MRIYKIGIIGYGGFGQFLRHSWESLDHVCVTAVADEIASRNPGDIKFYNRWEDLIQDGELDIVSIATPPNTHAPMARAAMRAGRNVLVEKPMATTVEAAWEMLAVRDRSHRVATVNYMLRFDPLVELLGRLTAKGIWGQLRHVDVQNYAQDEGLPPSHWFWDHEVSGGILIEHAVHFIDLVHSLTSQKVKTVKGMVHNRNPLQEDRVLATVHYENGLIATHYHAFSRPGYFENTSIRLVYDLAQIDLEGWIPMNGRIRALVNAQSAEHLVQLPNFKIEQLVDVDKVADVSRVEGWGLVSTHPEEADRRNIRSGGIEYQVDQLLVGRFDLGHSKQHIYTECVKAMISDIIMKIENPGHQLRVTLEDGLSSLDVACRATESGRHELGDPCKEVARHMA